MTDADQLRTGTLDRAAWVPFAEGRSLEEASALAVDWVEVQCARQCVSGVLLTSSFGIETFVPALTDFTRRHRQTTPRAGNRSEFRGVPVLAYFPNLKMMVQAISSARGSSLAVVEAPDFALSGWARETRATDLTDPNAVVAPLNRRLVEGIAHLHSYGNNAYTTGFGRDQAQRVLRELRSEGHLDQDAILGAVLARGMSEHAIERLKQLITEVKGKPR
ncbi:hypothetical protein ACFV9D_05815 [Streptomyces sp. NPDC059875]|uniref:hypothetical protein n=1 Tax=unclassified Streptomyces TaxID=2593676 RepID=UPI0036619D61